MRIFLGLTEVAGYYSNLHAGLTRKGVDVEFVSLVNHRFGYAHASSRRWFPRLFVRLLTLEERYNSRILARISSFIVRFPLRIPLFIWAVLTFDVFIFSFGFSFFNLMDLPLLRILGKTVICQFHGSDSRPPYIDGPFLKRIKTIDKDNIRAIQRKRRQIDRINRYANIIIDTPTAGHFHSQPFVNWMVIGIPCILPKDTSSRNHRDDRRVRILHSPSDPTIKGTAIIRSLVKELQQELASAGYVIEYVEVTGRPHEEVLRELAACDIVFDQMFADYGMPGFASEAAAYGKPVVIGGYAADEWNLECPNGVRLPTHYVLPGDIKRILRGLIVDSQFRDESGRIHRHFVEETWEAAVVAERYIKLIEGEDHSSWMVDPQEIRYVLGCGVSEEQVRNILHGMITRFGTGSLQLSDKPELVQKFKELAQAENG